MQQYQKYQCYSAAPHAETYQALLYTNEIAHVDDLWSFSDIEVNLIDNPLHCGAASSWMGEEDLMLEHGFTCATPVCLQDMVIADMSELLKQIPRPEHIEVETKLPTFCEESFKLICFCINCCYLIRIQLKYVHNGKITISRCWLYAHFVTKNLHYGHIYVHIKERKPLRRCCFMQSIKKYTITYAKIPIKYWSVVSYNSIKTHTIAYVKIPMK